MIYASAVTVAMLRRRRQLATEMMARRARERAGGPSPANPAAERRRPHRPAYWRFIADEFRHLGGALGRVLRRMRGR
ncbi:hypothetical protein CMK11_12415 [Candidatus Poribacteria bacterium]|nr:hypothetical protein [Candidatus Poribacteria bacterium]